MPLTAKGEEIKSALVKEYGEKKGEQVLYAGKNSGTFTGIDSMNRDARFDLATRRMDAIGARMDALCARRDN